MEFIADLHIHSKYSRATSRDMDVKNLAKWARLKGIKLMGTGDFTHFLWLRELKANLQEQGNGLFRHQDISFMLTAEISSIYSKKGRTYRVHNLVFAPSFKTVEKINAALGRRGNLAADGRPILGMDCAELAKTVFDIDENCVLVPAHIWTPWFSLFGSMSGFDRIEDCFEEQTPNIFCLETGLSSDPPMNWRLSRLDRFSLISNSDSHSPQKIGREANIFNCDLDYRSIREALRTKDSGKFVSTIEFFPEEGKYHFDGHRLCGVRFSPEQTRQGKGKCPVCGKGLTVGVMNRVEQLADRPEGFVPDNKVPHKNLIPLAEIIAEVKGVGKLSATVMNEYMDIVRRFGNEFNVLLRLSEEELASGLPKPLVEAIIRTREGKVRIKPGYDGEYGVISIKAEESAAAETGEQQLRLF